MPVQDGGLEDPSLVTHLLVQGDLTGCDAGHDVRAGDTDQVSRVLCAENRIRCRFGLGGRGLSGAAADGGVPEELREFALDQPRGLGCQLDVAPHDFDQRIDIDVHRQRRRGDALRGFGGLAGGLAAFLGYALLARKHKPEQLAQRMENRQP